ncbi:MAG: GNAT family N-acetyltransferase [Planctomycetota bacterium]
MSVTYVHNAQLDRADVAGIADVHWRCLPRSGLRRLGKGILEPLYRTLRDHDHGILIAARHRGQIIGFVSGTTHLRSIYVAFLRRHFLRASFALAPRLLSPGMFRRIIETALYPFRRGGRRQDLAGLPRAELLSIAVTDAWRGKGVAAGLYTRLTAEVQERGAPAFKIVAGEALRRAHRFYRKMGAERVAELAVHKGERSFVYIQRVEAPDA